MFLSEPNTKNLNEYIIVLHFSQNAKSNFFFFFYAKFFVGESCKDELDKGNIVKSITIINGGNEETLLCD